MKLPALAPWAFVVLPQLHSLVKIIDKQAESCAFVVRKRESEALLRTPIAAHHDLVFPARVQSIYEQTCFMWKKRGRHSIYLKRKLS